MIRFQEFLYFFPKAHYRTVIVFAGLLSALSVLDLIGLLLLGLMSAITVLNIQSISPSGLLAQSLNFLRVDALEFQLQVIILVIVSVTLMLTKSCLSMLIQKKLLIFVNESASKTSSSLAKRYFDGGLREAQQFNLPTMLHAINSGPLSFSNGILVPLVLMISDFGLLIILSIGLALVDPQITLMSSFLGAIFFMVTYKGLNRKLRENSELLTKISIDTNSTLIDMYNLFREYTVSGIFPEQQEKFKLERSQLGRVTAKNSFYLGLSKYFFEIGILVFGFSLSVIQFVRYDVSSAVSTLTLILLTSARVAPAIIRIQQATFSIRSHWASNKPSRDLVALIEQRLHLKNLSFENHQEITEQGIFIAEIKLERVSFSYKLESSWTLKNVSLHISQGEFVAIVGPSGAGKSSLVDLLLGINSPDSGQVSLSGLSPSKAIKLFPGKVAYVPQSTHLMNSSVWQNVSLRSRESTNFELVNSALIQANLMRLVNELPIGVETKLGESGTLLSGGERQRMGIARALYTKPELLVLDEATSSLDSDSERLIMDSVINAFPNKTRIVVAHRLSTITRAHRIIYLEQGEIIAQGTFEEVRREVRNFDKQARLLGL